jgi:hypothetical protein
MHLARTAAIALAVLAVSFVERVARADRTVPADPHAAYDRALRAHKAGDYATAAREFMRADILAPSDAALEAALEDAMRADDAVLGAELVDRADRRTDADARLQKSLEAAHRRFDGRTGKIVVECMSCLVAVDGVGVEMLRPIFVAPGSHAVRLQQDGEQHEEIVDVGAGRIVTVRMPSTGAAAPRDVAPKPLPPAPSEKSGVAPMWFYMGLAGTTLAGTFTTLSIIDTLKKHDRFVSDGCLAGTTGPHPTDCGPRSTEGENAQTRTNILLGATAILAVSTAVLGIFVANGSARVGFGATSTGAQASVAVSTP